MNHKDLINAVASSMADKEEMVKDIKENENVKPVSAPSQNEEEELFIIPFPFSTGRGFKVDSRSIDWSIFDSEENRVALEENENSIRNMVYDLITADFTKPETELMLKNYDEGLDKLFQSFGIEDPGYSELSQKMQVKPYILLFAKCFDALSMINTISHNASLHRFATQVFSFSKDLKDVADLNDITEMDNSVEGLISEDRESFEPTNIDDHDVSGLVSE